MKLNNYQFDTSYFVKKSIKNNENYFALGLCSEAGEVADKIKKHMRDGTIDMEGLQKELGDCLFYIAQLGLCFGMDLEGIAAMNLKKLESRKRRGMIEGSGDNR